MRNEYPIRYELKWQVPHHNKNNSEINHQILYSCSKNQRIPFYE